MTSAFTQRTPPRDSPHALLRHDTSLDAAKLTNSLEKQLPMASAGGCLPIYSLLATLRSTTESMTFSQAEHRVGASMEQAWPRNTAERPCAFMLRQWTMRSTMPHAKSRPQSQRLAIFQSALPLRESFDSAEWWAAHSAAPFTRR